MKNLALMVFNAMIRDSSLLFWATL